MNFYGNKSSDDHTLAGRLIPFGEAMHHAVMKAAGQPVPEAKHSIALPGWCHKICDELTKSIFGNLVKAAVRENKISFRNYGRVVGMLLRGAVFFFKDAPALLKQDGLLDLNKDQEAKLEKFTGTPLLLAAASDTLQKPISNEDELHQASADYLDQKMEALINGGLTMLRHLWNQPVKEQHEFLRGIPEGFVALVDNLGEFSGKRNRYGVFILLVTHWPEIAEMQKAQPPKTRRELLEWLDKQEGRQIVEDPKQFYDLCGDIDLNLAPPGPPQKTKPA